MRFKIIDAPEKCNEYTKNVHGKYCHRFILKRKGKAAGCVCASCRGSCTLYTELGIFNKNEKEKRDVVFVTPTRKSRSRSGSSRHSFFM